jgi:hypothetical protein
MLLTAMRMYCVTVVYRITEQTGLDNQSARFSIRSAFMRTLWIYYACSFVYVSGKSVFLIIYCPSMFKKMFAFFLLLIVVSAAFFRENCHFYTEK